MLRLKINKFFVACAAILSLTGMTMLLAPGISAQSPAWSSSRQAPADTMRFRLSDSIAVVPALRVDTSLVGSHIFTLLSAIRRSDSQDPSVFILQSRTVEDAMDRMIEANKERSFEGYRVRIFFKESARAESEEVVKVFEARYPGIPAYRSYANPYFKVTVGDFRTKSEAMQLMSRIITEYPTAFVVKEPIGYPVVDKNDTYHLDTLKVVRSY